MDRMSADFHLPLSASAGAVNDPWKVDQQPSTLIGFWPGDTEPTKVEVLKALEQYWAVEALPQVEELDGALWNGVFSLPGITRPVIIWAEPASPLTPGELNDPFTESRRWIVGFEFMLDPAQPIDEYANLLRAMAGGLACTTVLDPITQRYWQSTALADLTCASPSELVAEDLWAIHAVPGRDSRDAKGAVWLHTHGLWRLGCPELEMLEVPHERSGSAADFLNELGAFVLHSGLIAPGELMEIGPDLTITAHPWQSLAPLVDSRHAGGLDDRKGEDNPHAGVRAVLCGSRPHGVLRRVWTWPQETVERFRHHDAVVFRTKAQTERQARLAREKWDDLATAFADTHNLARVCLVKAALGRHADAHEYLWLKVLHFDGATAHARVLTAPVLDAGVQLDQVCELQRDMISDWQMQTHHGQFGPQNVPAMWRTIQMMKESRDATRQPS